MKKLYLQTTEPPKETPEEQNWRNDRIRETHNGNRKYYDKESADREQAAQKQNAKAWLGENDIDSDDYIPPNLDQHIRRIPIDREFPGVLDGTHIVGGQEIPQEPTREARAWMTGLRLNDQTPEMPFEPHPEIPFHDINEHYVPRETWDQYIDVNGQPIAPEQQQASEVEPDREEPNTPIEETFDDINYPLEYHEEDFEIRASEEESEEITEPNEEEPLEQDDDPVTMAERTGYMGASGELTESDLSEIIEASESEEAITEAVTEWDTENEADQ